MKLAGSDGRKVIVPDHSEVKTGTLSLILRQAGLSRVEFEALL